MSPELPPPNVAIPETAKLAIDLLKNLSRTWKQAQSNNSEVAPIVCYQTMSNLNAVLEDGLILGYFARKNFIPTPDGNWMEDRSLSAESPRVMAEIESSRTPNDFLTRV
jgi:hypothetical protein